MTSVAELAARLSHPSPTVRRIAALDALSRDSLDEALVLHAATSACQESDARARVLLARVVERHASGVSAPKGLLASLHAARAACDDPLGRHALLLAGDALEVSIVRE